MLYERATTQNCASIKAGIYREAQHYTEVVLSEFHLVQIMIKMVYRNNNSNPN